MKKITWMMVSALVMGSMSASAQAQAVHKRVAGSFFANANLMDTPWEGGQALRQQGKVAKASAATGYKPAAESVYEYDAEKDAWNLSSKYAYEYDAKGRTVKTTETTEEGVTVTEYAYSDDGLTYTEVQKVSEDGGATFVNSSKRVQKYDPLANGLVIEKQRFTWDEEANEWVASTDAFRRDITRDADGNVTSLQISVPYDGSYDVTERYTNTVNPSTKQIDSYKYERLGYDESFNPVWETAEYLTDIQWQKTNGQIVSQYDEWMEWGNYVASAHLSYVEDGVTSNFGSIKVTYKDDGGGFKEVFDYTDQLERTVTEKTMTDGYGSYVLEAKTLADDNEDGVLDDSDVTDWTKSVVTYDGHSNLVEEELYMLAEDEPVLEKVMGNKYTYTYDVAHGDAWKEQMQSDYDYDAKEYVPMIKVVVDSFVDVTSGIGEARKDAADDAVTVYNLQGVKMNEAAAQGKGLYIVKKGNRTIKVMR